MLPQEVFVGTRFYFRKFLCTPGVCPEAAPRRRVPEEDGRTVRVRPVHRQLSQGERRAAAASRDLSRLVKKN